jgi:hypothetical protein
MAGAHYFGYVLIALSAVFLALHWQQWRDWRLRGGDKRREFIRRQLQRRVVASALIGVVGAAMVFVDRVPRNPAAMTAYLFALVLAGGVIFSIALADMRATRRLRHEEQLDLLAEELRKATAKAASEQDKPLIHAN